MERALMCPQCNAPLPPQRFASAVVCSYCGSTVRLDEASVSAEKFRQAFRVWNSPASYRFPSWISVGDSHWVLDKCIANGDISDVYTGQRARWPTELVIIKLLRNLHDKPLFDNEWEVLHLLDRSDAPGSDTFTALIPQPVLQGATGGSGSGQSVHIFRWASGFYHTFDEVLRAYPQGIHPRASIWIWRRILEVLSFIHNSGLVHGAVLPSHLLVQENEHGIRLVGYSSAGRIGEKLRRIPGRFESFYLSPMLSALTPQLDLIMSARCIVAMLGGNVQTGALPKAVPRRLARLVQQIALNDASDSLRDNAWSVREELGAIADEVFGAPQFIPIVMPT